MCCARRSEETAMGIKLKMTLWYTILALVTAGLMGGLLFIAAQRSAYEYYSDTLHAASALAQSQLEYESGNLEIDDDLEDIPDVHIALYTESGTKETTLPLSTDILGEWFAED